VFSRFSASIPNEFLGGSRFAATAFTCSGDAITSCIGATSVVSLYEMSESASLIARDIVRAVVLSTQFQNL
jgi:hypothetical protein|tara:strand:- start:165 stop:377 length:213 start_codon:yes stop_codon:yes gene_type:complete